MKQIAIPLLLAPALWVSAAAQTLPSADQIIDKYLAAIGGKKALMAIKDATCQITMHGNNALMQLTLKQKAPAKSYQIVTSDNGQLIYKNIIDGTNMIEITPQGTSRKSGADARLSIMHNQLFPELSYHEQGIKSTVMGTEQVDGRDAYKVTSTFADGSPLWTNYYDVATGMKVKNSITWPDGNAATSKYGDYKDVKGVKIPFNGTYETIGGIISIKINLVQINKGIDDSEFNIH